MPIIKILETQGYGGAQFHIKLDWDVEQKQYRVRKGFHLVNLTDSWDEAYTEYMQYVIEAQIKYVAQRRED